MVRANVGNYYRKKVMKKDELYLAKLHASKTLHEEINSRAPSTRKIQQLIEQGADINFQAEIDGYTALMLAVDTDNQRITEYLLTLGANPLLCNHHYEIASQLALRHSPLYLVLKDYELLFATLSNDLKGVKSIIDDGAIVNFQAPDGYTALIIAVEESLIEMTELLLSKGADLMLTRADGQGVFELVTNEEVMILLESSTEAIHHEIQEIAPPPLDNNVGRSLESKPINTPVQKPQNFFFGFNNNRKNKLSVYEQPVLNKTIIENNDPELPIFDLSKLNIKPHDRFGFEHSASETQIVELEKRFGHALPESYKELLRQFNGGSPDLKYYGRDKEICNFSSFLSLGNQKNPSELNLWQVIDRFPMFFESGYLPFALDLANGIYFFVWQGSVAQVWILRRDELGALKFDKEGDAVNEFVAHSFDKLLEDLCEYHEKYEQKAMAGEFFNDVVEPFDLSLLKISPQNWAGFEPTATNAQIDELEKSVGNMLPENYKKILGKYNGGDPEFNRFDIDGETYSLNYFYSLGDRKDSSPNIWWALNGFSEYAGPNTLPFAVDGTNETYFFKWVNGIAQIWILRCDELVEPEADFVTYSFDELLRALYRAD